MMSSLIRKLYLFNAKSDAEKKKKPKVVVKKSEKKNESDKSGGGDDKRLSTKTNKSEETNTFLKR